MIKDVKIFLLFPLVILIRYDMAGFGIGYFLLLLVNASEAKRVPPT
jgi:hypothetical protein